jgi:hypothetical protein
VDAQDASRVLVLEIRETGRPDAAVAHRLFIDPQSYVPVEWDIFKEGRFFSTVRFNEFRTVPNIDESLFQL